MVGGSMFFEQLAATGQAERNAEKQHKDRERREQIDVRVQSALWKKDGLSSLM